MNNEPVAWMLLGLEDRKPKLINLQVIEHLEGTWIPLYLHPANTLKDAALKTFYEDRLEAGRKREETLLKTIEALLRKAQEK